MLQSRKVEVWVNCQDMSYSAQHRDKSHTTVTTSHDNWRAIPCKQLVIPCYRYPNIEASWLKAGALHNVLQEQLTFDFPFESRLLCTSQFSIEEWTDIYSLSMLRAMSTPTYTYPSPLRISLDRPEPPLISRRKVISPGGISSSSRARYLMSAWTCWMQVL